MRILLIDDDEVFRQRLALSLHKRGHQARCADGMGALEALCQPWDDGEPAAPPEAVLVDLRMPGEGGLALIARIAAQAPKARIVMLTGYGSIATAMEAVRQGAADYLTKPAGIQQILAALEGRGAGGAVADAYASAAGSGDPAGSDVPSLDRVEWEHLQRVLADCGNNISRAARVLGIDRRSLQRKLAKHPPLR